MARGIERRTIYSDESYYRKLEELLANLPERFRLRLHTYVLMPNQYHLQIETPRLNLSEAIKWLNLSYVSWFNRKTRRNGPLLQGRFKARCCPNPRAGAGRVASRTGYRRADQSTPTTRDK
jgi:putative transposase